MKTGICLRTLVILFLCVASLSQIQAVTPPPDGGYASFNTAEGQNALFNLTTGSADTAVGWYALFAGTAGSFNTGLGAGALLFNTANNNTANGAGALLNNTIGDRNTGTGTFVLLNNTTGDSNTAQGFQALFQNTAGARNTAIGRETLLSNTTGIENTATGSVALRNNTSGQDNTATGFAALNNNTTGKLNAAVGTGSLFNSTGDLNIAFGFGAGSNLTMGNNNIDLGNIGALSEANTIRLGDQVAVTDPFGVLHPAHTATYIAGIHDADAVGGDTVFITADGKLGTINVPSAARYKQEIRPMDKASEVILALKPVTFCYKKELDPTGVRQFGLVAEEVEKTAPDLIKRNRNGEVQTVRYDAVNAMLLNEFLKEHRKMEEQQATITQLKAEFQRERAEQQKQIDALVSGLRKVNAELELNKAAAPLALNNR